MGGKSRMKLSPKSGDMVENGATHEVPAEQPPVIEEAIYAL